MDAQQITVKRVERPSRRTFEEELEWFCETFGIAEEENSLGREILEEILRKEQRGSGIRSISISRKMRITRGGAVYHLNKLMQTGLIVRQGREYSLRGENLRDTVEGIEEDMRRVFKAIRRMADQMDEELGIQRETE